MWKHIFLVGLTIVALALQQATTAKLQKDRKDSRLTAITRECKITENATESDIQNLKTISGTKSKAIKCLSTCISEKMGIITNHQLNPVGVAKLLKTAPNVSDKMNQSIGEIINECKSIRDSDRCEFGAKIMDCINNGGVKHAIKYVI